MIRRVDARPPDPDRAVDEVLETSRLLLELIHAAHATREAEQPEPSPASPTDAHGPDRRIVVSAHAIRAAIHVHQHGDRTVGELAQGLGISYGWASRVVSELEASSLAARAIDPADRRVVHVSLTPRAIDVVERAYRWRGDVIERALAPLDESGRRAVRTFLRRVVEELSTTGHERRPGANAGPVRPDGGPAP